MRELITEEVNEVSGGYYFVWGAAKTLGGAIAGSYAYQALGGKEGIDQSLNRYFTNGWASTKSSYRYWKRKIERNLKKLD